MNKAQIPAVVAMSVIGIVAGFTFRFGFELIWSLVKLISTNCSL